MTDQIKIHSHSTLFYWWPVWLTGFILAVMSKVYGVGTENGGVVINRDVPHLVFLIVSAVTLIVANTKVRGLASLLSAALIAIIVGLLYLSGFLELVLETLGGVDARASGGFYLVGATGLFVIWLMLYTLFDRLTYWTITHGQLTEVNVIGGNTVTFDARGLIVEKLSDDMIRHRLIGFGSGDIILRTSNDAGGTELRLYNVMNVDRCVKKIRALIAVEPQTLTTSELSV